MTYSPGLGAVLALSASTSLALYAGACSPSADVARGSGSSGAAPANPDASDQGGDPDSSADPADAAPSQDGSPPGSDARATGQMRAFITLVQGTLGGAVDREIHGSFREAAIRFRIPDESQAATIVVRGPCTFREWSFQQQPPPSRPRSGLITITGPKHPAGLIVTESGYEGDFQLALADPIWQDGDELQVTTSGSSLPPFGGKIRPPSPSALPAPLSQLGAVSSSAPLSVSWTGGGGQLVMKLIATQNTLTCSWPASAGQGTIPAELLSRLGPVRTLGEVYNETATSTLSADFTIVLRARALVDYAYVTLQ